MWDKSVVFNLEVATVKIWMPLKSDISFLIIVDLTFPEYWWENFIHYDKRAILATSALSGRM